jgi:hypothetical protein
MYRNLALPLTAAAMIAISMVWVVERSFDVQLPRPGTIVTVVRTWLA